LRNIVTKAVQDRLKQTSF